MTTNWMLPLRKLIAIDAVICLLSATGLILFAEEIASLTVLPQQLLFWAGVSLVPSAVFMGATARPDQTPRWAAWTIVIGNGLWVAASLALAFSGLVEPNIYGWAFVMSQAVVVAVLAELEFSALKAKPILAA